MKIRSEGFSALTPVTFYGVALSPVHNINEAWFLRFTGTNKEELAQIALECTNGERGTFRKDQVKMVEININEVSWHE